MLHGAGIFTYIWNLDIFFFGQMLVCIWVIHIMVIVLIVYSDYSSHYGNHNSLNEYHLIGIIISNIIII